MKRQSLHEVYLCQSFARDESKVKVILNRLANEEGGISHMGSQVCCPEKESCGNDSQRRMRYKREFKVGGERNALGVKPLCRADRRANENQELSKLTNEKGNFLELRMERNALGRSFPLDI